MLYTYFTYYQQSTECGHTFSFGAMPRERITINQLMLTNGEQVDYIILQAAYELTIGFL